MSLKEVAQKFSMSKKELDQAYFSEMRSILNAVEIELNQARNNQKELLEAAEYVIMKNDEIEMTGFRELLEAVNKAKGDNNA